MDDSAAHSYSVAPSGERRPAVTSPGAYPDYANPELLEKIPLTARTLLDVGCAQGALGAAYLRRNPKARFLGVDLDAGAVAHAALRLTDAVCADIEATPMPFAVPEGVDCIIYGDVLEHLRNPWALLAQHVESLNQGGTVLVCMPNVEHWSLALRLLNGSFNYEDQGLLDRTHLRWFTPRTMADALTKAGLELADISPRPIDTEQARLFATALAPGLKAIGVDPNEYFNRAGPLQFIWRARKAAPTRLVMNATMLAPLGGVSELRVTQPTRALRTDSAILSAVMPEPEMAPPFPDLPRIAILHRPLLLGAAGIDRIKTLLAKNYVIVSEFDDHPVFMQERGVPMEELLTFKAVHAVQTSTPALAAVLAQENPETAMFANCIFELPEPQNFANPDQLTLFFGALNREDDWAPLLPGLNEVARAVGKRLCFSIAHDKAFFEALDTPHKVFTPTCDYPEYMRLLGAADIAFMPLNDNAFNRAKSDLKFIEASACRVVSLASRVVYAESIEDGKTGLLFSDSMEMRSHLLRILAYPEAARRMANAARDYVAEHRMQAYQTAPRIAWYRSLWEKRDALNDALRARVPALFE